jgi:hypothetical protein
VKEKKDIPFKQWNGGGVCDVCNKPLTGGKAYAVPVDTFYASKKYREHVTKLHRLMGIPVEMLGGIDALMSRNRSLDKSTHSAVCSDCINMFT